MYTLQAVAIGGMTPFIFYVGSSLGEWSALRPGRFTPRWHIPRCRMNRGLGSLQSWPEPSGITHVRVLSQK